ncbi:efflux RND transporter periplasmic adaptor subunit [Hydrogenovibrio kuenenii]|uniref:efflux RND transporter periplasmic adaptor subunit n=1 Tax=Hydrogenovibrio kuenenii TaxID=63658 RepID=UPI00046503FA|nr:efflux RND transporter periplasmic adaptor subunit [Hydrogenovibrio kuenenii]
MKKRILLLVILIIVSASAYWFVTKTSSSETNGSIKLYGNVDIRQVNLAFQVTGQIEKIDVQEGSRVKAGQKLACVDKTRYKAQLDLAQEQVNSLQAQLDKMLAGNRPEEIAQAKNRYLGAKAEAEQAQKSYQRLNSLLPKKMASQDDVDIASTKADAARHNEIAAKNAWIVAKLGARKEDIAQVRAQIAQAQAQVALAQKNFTDANLISPVDGVIRDRVLEPGDIAQPMQTVMTLALQNPKWVRAYVSEKQLGHVKLGLPATITTDSYPGKVYQGWVGYLSPVAEFTPKTVQTDDLRTQLVYQVRIYTCDTSGELRLGMPATVHINPHSTPLKEPTCSVKTQDTSTEADFN